MRTLIILLLAIAIGQSRAQTNANSTSYNYIIRNVNIIPIDKDTVIKNQLVNITGNKITLITDDNDKAFKPNDRFIIIDGRDKYLMPSMADMHAHFPEYSELKKYFTLNLLAGVTTMRSMRGDEKHLTIKYTDEQLEVIEELRNLCEQANELMLSLTVPVKMKGIKKFEEIMTNLEDAELALDEILNMK